MNKSLPIYSVDTYSQTLIAHRYKVSTKSKIIYTVVVVTVLGALSALPFIYTQISIKSAGLLQSSVEKTELIIPVSGRLVRLKMEDNQKIVRGDTLLTIDAALPKQQDALIQTRTTELNHFLNDIKKITDFASVTSQQAVEPGLQTEQYTATWQQFTKNQKIYITQWIRL